MTKQDDAKKDAVQMAPDCAERKANAGWDDCMCGQVCEMINAYNNSKDEKTKLDPSPSKPDSPLRPQYSKSIATFEDNFASLVAKHVDNLDHPEVKAQFYSPGPPAPPDCQHAKWKDMGGSGDPARSGPGAMNPDHMHPASLSGPLTASNLKWADGRVNSTVGGGMNKLETAPPKMKAHASCNCS